MGLCLLAGASLAASLLLACSGDSPPDPAPLGTGVTRDGGPGSTDLTLEASLADTGAGELSFHGTLAATATVSFGGSYADVSYCKYTVVLKNVGIDLVVQGNDLVASTVKDLMVETVVGTCGTPAQPDNAQVFALSKEATATSSGGFHAEYLNASGNQPKESLVVDLTKTDEGYSASATWHRTDIFHPFDWTVTGTIAVTAE